MAPDGTMAIPTPARTKPVVVELGHRRRMPERLSSRRSGTVDNAARAEIVGQGNKWKTH